MLRLIKGVANYTQVVAPTTSTTDSCVYFNRIPLGKIHVFGCGNGWLYITQSGESPSSYTNLRWSNIQNAFDADINTYASASVAAGTAETDSLVVDYGSVASRVLYVKGSTVHSIPYVTLRFYYSQDGTNWSLFLTISPNTTKEATYIGNMRYVKVTVENTSSNNSYAYLHEIWAVTTANCYAVAPTWESGIQKLSLGLPRYFVFAKPNPSITYAIYEENVPASVQEVVIE